MHSRGFCGPQLQPVDLVARMVAYGVQVGSALVWGAPDSWSPTGDRPYFTGRDDPASVARAILHYDLEVSIFGAAQMGHLVMLNLDSIDFAPNPIDAPMSGIPVMRWAQTQGRALIGMSHAQQWPRNGTFPRPGVECCSPYEFPIHVALATEDIFLEFEERGLGGGFDLWKSLLNAGFRVPLTGASDFPCLSGDVGETRTRALVEEPVSYTAFVEAIRKGRSVYVEVNAGELDLRVNEGRLGDEVLVTRGSTLTLTVDARLPAEGDVSILINGQTAQTVSIGSGPVSFQTVLTASTSAWMAVQTRGILTSPIYVIVDGKPIRSAPDACYLMRYVDHLTDLVRGGVIDLEASKEEALKAYAAARNVFALRHRQGGGTTCP